MGGNTAIGLLACTTSSVFFGTAFTPIKRYNPGDGIVVQWIMCSAIMIAGIFVNAIEDFPQYQPLAMVGGVLWALGNLTAVPIIHLIGLGQGMLVWGTVNCLVGWASGRFGFFGISASTPTMPWMNYIGVVLVVIGGFLFAQIRPSVSTTTENGEVVPSADGAVLTGEDERLLGESESAERPVFEHMPRNVRRTLGLTLSLIAGIFYGFTFIPVIYIQEHKEDFIRPPKDAIAYAFSHYCGIYVTSTAALLAYLIYTRNQPYINSRAVLPGFIAGILWAVAQLSWFIANDALSQAITFPIISMVPGVIASCWSVFYFKEIRGRRNIRMLCIAVGVTLSGATLVGLSK